MHTKWHVFSAIPLALLTYLAFKSIESASTCFVASFIIDLDHPLDYLMHYGFKMNTKELMSGVYFEKRGKAYVFFHSYELLIPVWTLLPLMDMSTYAVGFTIGFLSHLIFDILTNRVSPQGFLLTYRIIKKFRLTPVCKDASKEVHGKKYFIESDYHSLWAKEVYTKASSIGPSTRFAQTYMKMIDPVPNERLLDVGAGEGRFSSLCIKAGINCYIGLDISKLTLLKIKENVRKSVDECNCYADLVLADAEHIPFRDLTFDKVVCIATSWFLPHQSLLVSEAFRVLKTHGTFFCDFQNASNLRVYLYCKMRSNAGKILGLTRKLRLDHIFELIAFSLFRIHKKEYDLGKDRMESLLTYGVPPFYPSSFSNVIRLFRDNGFKLQKIVGNKRDPSLIVLGVKSRTLPM